jgi:hypothetical protein
MSAEARLKELGLVLPVLPKPAANYLPYRLAGNILYLAGQGPRDANGASLTGKLGAEISVDEGYRRARLVGLGLLAAMRDALGSLDRVDFIVKLLSSTAARTCSSKCSATPGGTPAPRSATSCCPTRFPSRSRVSSQSRRKERPPARGRRARTAPKLQRHFVAAVAGAVSRR